MIEPSPRTTPTWGLPSLGAVLLLLATFHVGTAAGAGFLVHRLTSSTTAAYIVGVLTWMVARAFIVNRFGRWLRRSFRALGERHRRESKRLSPASRLFIAAVATGYGNPLGAYDGDFSLLDAEVIDLFAAVTKKIRGLGPAGAVPRFDVVITAVAPRRRLEVISTVRGLTGLGLADAKALVDNLPALVAKGVDLQSAESNKSLLELLGADVTITAAEP